MMNLLMNDTVVWGLITAGVLLLAWMWWPKKKVAEALEEVKAEEKVAAPVETQITDAVTVKEPKQKKQPVLETPKNVVIKQSNFFSAPPRLWGKMRKSHNRGDAEAQ